MKPALFQRAFGSTVITEPDQPTPLNPAWQRLEAQPLKRHSLQIVMSGAPLVTGRIVLVDIASPVRVHGTRDHNIRVVRFVLDGDSDVLVNGKALPERPAAMIAREADTVFTSSGCISLHLQLPASKLERAAGWNDTGRGLPDVDLSEEDGGSMRELVFVASRHLGQLRDELRKSFARNLEHLLAVRWGAAILEQLPDIRRPDPMIGRRKVADLREWAALDHDDPLTVGDLAARCGLGLRALQKNFLRHFEVTPAEFLRKLRLEKARKLILSGAFTVTHAALQAGFVHLGHFSENYEREFGELPSVTSSRALRS
ncbi:MAG: helix-turn-helix transcriptional regulator [Chthoniobacterales bacterium]